MRKCKLSECVKEINDKTTKNNQYEVLTSSKNGILSQEEYFDKQVASKDNTGYKIIKKGQFTYRSMSDSGTFTINRLEDKEIGIVSPAYPVFEATNIDAEYLKYYFKSELFNKAIINLSQGSTRTALKYKDLIDIEIYLPEIEEQKKIVKILKNNDQVIEKYDELIKEKEQFIKSQFVEMFGNCTINNKGFEIVKIENVAEVSSSKRIYASEYQKSGIPFYRSKEIIELGNNRQPTTELFISPDRYMEIKEKYDIPKKGDVLITAVGTIGEMWIVNNDVPFYYKDGNVLQIRLGNTITQIYFKYILNTLIESFKRKNTSGSAYPALTIEKFKKMNVVLPTMGLQKEFEKIVQLIDKQKFELEKQKGNYIELKKGLMQQLLTGKLKVN